MANEAKKPFFAKAPKGKGKLVVFEGIDGSGKTTQAKLLFKALRLSKIPVEYISFPRYKDSFWGAMVRRFLDGEFGENVDPYFASTLYAGDRFSASKIIKKWIEDGKIVVCDRYVGSNLAHMGAKFQNPNSKIQYVEWLEKLEYEENQIPREDLVIFLSVKPGQTAKLMSGRTLDIHEKDVSYQQKVQEVYQFLAKRKNWMTVEEENGGRLLSKKRVNEFVVSQLKKRGII